MIFSSLGDGMKMEFIINADGCYQQAEERASRYFKTLYEQVIQKNYVPTLIKDFELWKQNHIHHTSLFPFSFLKKKPSTKDFYHYLKWLDYTHKLEHYLDRSISYIYLRDLGRRLDSSDTQKRIQSLVDNIKNQLTTTDRKNTFNIASLYRKAKEEGVESTFIWLVGKLKTVSSNIPEGIDALHAQRKLIKIIAGVIMHQIEEMDDGISKEARSKKIEKALRLGYCYGLTYPFIDDLLDSTFLSEIEKKRYSDLIRTSLMTGSVPPLGNRFGEKQKVMQYIHSELRDAFEYIRLHHLVETRKNFFEQAYVFFNSQELDREKNLFNESYTNEELYVPIILKSSSSRIIARSVINVPEDEGFENRTFLFGIYNQLADDFADMFDDMEQGAVTPYTYYLKYHETRPDLINPFELYWTVIFNLIHNVYHSDCKTREVILDRAINGLKRFKEKVGLKKYNEVMSFFALDNFELQKLIQTMVQKANDVDFFDKLLRDQIILTLNNGRKEQEEFIETTKRVRNQINNILHIHKSDQDFSINEQIIEAANYSLEGDGKRLRPIITWFIGVNMFGINEEAITPLLKSLEYMHTASLIFDDLPSQDNASLRRGRPTLHEVYNVAVAELTGLFLTEKAIEEQASLTPFHPKSVLKLIQYSAQMTTNMCKGQAMDLDSKGKQLTLEKLTTMCFYKTGIGFEASLVMPAILANVKESEIEVLKIFARHAGIAFQIKDDLLDVEGDYIKLGKSVGKDIENNHSTFVSILGSEGAKIEMWEHYCLAMESLQQFPHNTTFLKNLLNYIINREK